MDIIWALILLALIFFSVVLHEAGHALVASQFNIYSRSVILLPIGGVASIEKFPDNPMQELAVSFAGPFVNILIAMSLSAFLQPYTPFWNLNGYEGAISRENILFHLYAVNMFLAIVNLVPAFPLDGGRILRALLGFKFNYVKATSLAFLIGKIVAIITIIVGIILFNPFIPLLGIFILLFAKTEEYYLRLKSLVSGIKLKEALMYDYHSLRADMTVMEAASILDNQHSKFFIVMDGPDPVGTINRIEIIKAIAEMQYSITVKDLMKEDLKFFDANTNMETVLDKMSNDEEKIYPVMEDKHFAGVINFQHIIEYLLIHKAHTNEYGRIRSLAGLLG